MPFDLSKVLFITTANMLDTHPGPLRDRMEVLELQGYTAHEKVQIARNYLIPRQIQENGLEKTDIAFTLDAIRFIVHRYTREAGVRNLEREIGTICRKQARRIAENRSKSVEGAARKRLRVTPKRVEELLRAPRFRDDAELAERTQRPGVAVGLAWTPVGGDVLFIEAAAHAGQGQGVTAHRPARQGDAGVDAGGAGAGCARICLTLGVDQELFQNSDIHVHVPSGAIPKDGPSAGVTVATALASLLTGRKPCGRTWR